MHEAYDLVFRMFTVQVSPVKYVTGESIDSSTFATHLYRQPSCPGPDLVLYTIKDVGNIQRKSCQCNYFFFQQESRYTICCNVAVCHGQDKPFGESPEASRKHWQAKECGTSESNIIPRWVKTWLRPSLTHWHLRIRMWRIPPSKEGTPWHKG